MVRILSQLFAAVLVLTAAGVLAAKVNILGFWWENPIPFQQTPRNLKSIRAEDCATCHAEIYNEWKASTHAHALSDLQFKAEMSKSPQTNWLCLNCHTPLRNQVPEYAESVNNKSAKQPVMVKNPANDPVLRAEAVTCAVCHVRDGAIIGPTGSKLAPHPVKRDPEMLQASCGQCHQATADYGETLICTFDTYQEWKASPYAAKGQTCSSCHMPVISRPVAVGGTGGQAHPPTFRVGR